MEAKDIKIGTRLELEVKDIYTDNKSSHYVSQLLDIRDKDNIVIAAPISEGRVTYIPNNSKVTVVFKHPKYSLIAFDTILVSKSTQGALEVFNLNIAGKFYKIQRRGYYRLEIMLDAYYYKLPDAFPFEMPDDSEKEFIKVHTKNISGSGASIVSKNSMNVGDKLHLTLELPDGSKIETRCSVVRCFKDDNILNNLYNIGLKFINMNKRYEEKLVRFIFLKQKEILKSKKM